MPNYYFKSYSDNLLYPQCYFSELEFHNPLPLPTSGVYGTDALCLFPSFSTQFKFTVTHDTWKFLFCSSAFQNSYMTDMSKLPLQNILKYNDI